MDAVFESTSPERDPCAEWMVIVLDLHETEDLN
jgi:hypothetical protein